MHTSTNEIHSAKTRLDSETNQGKSAFGRFLGAVDGFNKAMIRAFPDDAPSWTIFR